MKTRTAMVQLATPVRPRDCVKFFAGNREYIARGWVGLMTLVAVGLAAGCSNRQDLDWAEYRKVSTGAAEQPGANLPAGVPFGSGSYGSGMMPYGSGMMPYGSGMMPYGSGMIPYGSGMMPYGSGMMPYGSGMMPFGSGMMPYGSGMMPYGSGMMPGFGTGASPFGGVGFGTSANGVGSFNPYQGIQGYAQGMGAMSRSGREPQYPKYGTPYPVQ